jgi:hypothetical protein
MSLALRPLREGFVCSYHAPLPGATVRVLNGDPDMLCGSWGEHPLGAGIAGQGPEGATRSNPCWRCYRPHAVGALVGAEGVVLAHLVEEMV